MKNISEKTERAKEIVKNAISKAKVPFVEFTGGKDSLVNLHLVRDLSHGTFSVLFIDTTVHFEEVYRFVEKMQKLWRFNLIREKNQEDFSLIKIAEDKIECCDKLKEKVLRNSIRKYEIDCLFTGLKMDEQTVIKDEEYFSQKEHHMRVNPIADFSETDVWEYIKKANLPYCSLYDKGYKNLECIPCTRMYPEPSMGENIQEIMKKLKKLGYV